MNELEARVEHDTEHDAEHDAEQLAVPSEREQVMARIIRKTVHAAGAQVEFAPRRRRSDLLLCIIRGDRQDVLRIPPNLAALFPDVDLEILRGEPGTPFYALTLAVTEKLDAQQTKEAERRAKLRRRLHRDGSSQHD